MARRVNSKFLIVSSIVLLCLVATGFIVAGPLKNHFWKGDRAKKLVEAADAQVKEADAADTSAAKREKLEAAIRNYQMALGADSKNPEIFLKLGDALTKMTPFDVMVYLPASRQTWENALEISPTYSPALHRLEDSYYRQVQEAAHTIGRHLGDRFTVVVNHLKSKGSDCNDVGDPDLGDGQGNCSQTRRKAPRNTGVWLMP